MAADLLWHLTTRAATTPASPDTVTRVIQRLAIFLGSRDGAVPRFAQEAYDVGTQLAARGVELVYGGGGAGLMGRVSQGVLDGGGRVYGVIPRFMVEREWGRLHEPGVQTHVVRTMHERKAMMTERAPDVVGRLLEPEVDAVAGAEEDREAGDHARQR